MYRDHRVAVVMPIHNEQDHVVRAIARVPSFVDVIVAVDDGSADCTWHRLSGLESDRLERIKHDSNRGVGAATKTGYRRAIAFESDLIAVMDGDGQMDGQDLHRLLDCAIDGADYVKGNRFLHRDSISAMPLMRLTGNIVLSRLTRVAARFEESLDAQCGYTVARRRALERIDLDRLYDRYGFPNEMLFACLEVGLKVSCVPVRSIYGSEVSGINPLTAVPRILLLIARGYLRRKALRQFSRTHQEIGGFESNWATRGSEGVR
jgi:glycosyltransferase involved in cell wall biosynthesis